MPSRMSYAFFMNNSIAYKRLQAEIDGLEDNVVDCAIQAHPSALR